MEILISLLALIVGLAVCVLLYFLSKKISFSLLTFIAMIFGVVIGIVFKNNVAYLNVIGSVYVKVISVMVIPLLMVSIIKCIFDMSSIKDLKSIGAKSVFWLLFQTLLAGIISLVLNVIFKVGVNANNSVVEGYETKIIPNISETIVNLFPSNIFQSMSSNHVIGCLIFSVIIGMAVVGLSQKKENDVESFKDLINSINKIIYYTIDNIIGFLPFAIVSLMAKTIAQSNKNIEMIKSLITVIIVTFVACIIHTCLTGGILISVVGKLNPIKYFNKILPAQIIAFTTQSSIATLPVNIECLEKKVGVSNKIANFTAPLSTTLGMAGCAGVWPIVLAIFAINSLGIEFTITQYIILVLMTPIISLGTVGVPGGGMLTATALFIAVGLPVEVVAIFAGIDAFVDMARTTCNVSSGMTASTLVSIGNKNFDKNIWNNNLQK